MFFSCGFHVVPLFTPRGGKRISGPRQEEEEKEGVEKKRAAIID